MHHEMKKETALLGILRHGTQATGLLRMLKIRARLILVALDNWLNVNLSDNVIAHLMAVWLNRRYGKDMDT